jgi:hypothetical protein
MIMKKLSLVLMMVFAAILVMAQKTTWINQLGNGNLANITQSSFVSGDANAIYAVQDGTGNILNTEQDGQNNYIKLDQGGTSNSAVMKQFVQHQLQPAGVNTADINQTGISGSANLLQSEINAIPGTYEYATNTVHATQSGNNNAYVLNQGELPWQPVNAQYLTQSGNGNVANILQTGITDYSEITQSGNGNVGNLHQPTTAGGIGTAKSYSWQTGTSNTLSILQDIDNSLQYVESTQNGVSNTTNVSQISWHAQQVIGNQFGTSDIINVSQTN